MSKASGSKLVVRLGASRRLAGLLSFIHAGAVACVLLAPLPAIIRLVLIPALAASLVYFLRQQAYRTSADAIVALELRDDRLAIQQRASSEWRICQWGSRFVHPHAVVVKLKTGRRSVGTVVFPDAIDPADFRELRAWLNIAT